MNDVDKRYEYHHINALGSNIVLTDDNQNVLVRYEYDVFGAIRNETGTSDNTRKFTGKEFDADSNLYYFATRYYDPYIGQIRAVLRPIRRFNPSMKTSLVKQNEPP